MQKQSLLSITLHNLTGTVLRDLLLTYLNSPLQHTIVTPNPEILLLAQNDQNLAAILNRADLSLPDGIGLKFAAWFCGFNLHRHTGVDTVSLLAKLCAETHQKFLLFGGQKENTEAAAEKLRQKFLKLDVVAFDPGVISKNGETNEEVIQKIYEISPSVLAVALGQGKQEKFINLYLSRLPSVKIAIGIGGAFDIISGNLPRAPLIIRFFGLEWLWRLLLEPFRWRRIVKAVLIFPIVVFWDKISRRK
jgi:N-acetylglucosaminyldiphosphoundecaprenol N-acetyl-beta-D-mannosaminyltransferase